MTDVFPSPAPFSENLYKILLIIFNDLARKTCILNLMTKLLT